MIARFFLMVLLTCFFASAGLAQPSLPPETLARIKRGTVLLETPSASGSGYVLCTRDGRTYLATCAHLFRFGRTRTVKVVFNSGTPDERSESAEVCGLDESSDLAVLSMTIAAPPQALSVAAKPDVPETTPVFVLGYPAAARLANPMSAPVVTITRASISSIVSETGGQATQLQLDGELNPGNSGGPIVNMNGELIGMALAKVSGTNISYGVPVAIIESATQGRVKRVQIKDGAAERGGIQFFFDVDLFDPLKAITTVAIVVGPDPLLSKEDELEYPIRRIARGQDHGLELKNGQATGPVTLSRSETVKSKFFQVEVRRIKGAPSYTTAAELPEWNSELADDRPRTSPDAQDFGQPEAPLETEKVLKLPGEITALEVAGGGRYLVLKLLDMPALTVIDTFKAEVVKHIRLPSSDFHFGAGGNTAIVHMRAKNLLQAYDLQTFECRKTKANPFGPAIQNILLGYGNGNRALVRHSVGTDQLSNSTLSLLDTARLESLDDPKSRGIIRSRNSSFRDRAHFRSNRDMSSISEWGTSGSPTGVGLLIRKGRSYDHRYAHDSAGYLAMSDDGRLYTQTGAIYSGRLEVIGRIDGAMLYPALGGTLYLGLTVDGKMMLYEAGKTKPIGPIGDFPGWKKEQLFPNQYDADALPADRRIVFDAMHGRIAMLPAENNRVVLRPFDLKTALEASGVDFLLVRSIPSLLVRQKEEWKYQIDAISKAGGIKYSLELAPPDMKVSDSGLVSWTPREPLAGEGEKVVIKLTDRSGEEIFHTFSLLESGGGD